ncbi:MAG TPA: RuBisCO large subunit C-terminal-like domain-containing protein [Chitinispirillaceae bacterium]|nr:RuBisCO large subunit C-terminal-like domain-containing protein [Chitinispirillaceae bacterium]
MNHGDFIARIKAFNYLFPFKPGFIPLTISSENIMETERFTVHYSIDAPDMNTAEQIANDITVEQTVEIPFDCIPQKHFEEGLIGRIESLEAGEKCFHTSISFRSDITSFQVTQFLNVLYGNISLKTGIKVVDIAFSPSFYSRFRGPALGIGGLRKLTSVYNRPLACTALKPMGLSIDGLVSMAESFTAGGIDLIKDDHGITDQEFHRFEERVTRCADAVERVNSSTGGNTLYFPCVSGTFDTVEKQVQLAVSRGIKGILIAPMLSGPDTVRYLSEKYRIVIMAHPAFTGSFFANRFSGISPSVLLGKIFRLIGADISVFPNWGGRFPLSKDDCTGIAEALREESGWRGAFPCPAGGMNLNRLPEMISVYGKETVLLIGGALMQDKRGIEKSTSDFMERIRSIR